MRLVDVDKIEPHEQLESLGNGQYEYVRVAYMDDIDALPTVDAVPVIHGRWIIKDNPGTGWYRVTCSECGEDVTSVAPVIGFFPKAKITWDFCPNCGAKMDGKDSEQHG